MKPGKSLEDREAPETEGLSVQSQTHLSRLLSPWIEFATPHQTNTAQTTADAVVG